MQNISAVVITLNEEKNIERCIASLKSVADEILVLDSFSTDSTVAIAEKNGAKVLQSEWKGYAASKNYANTLAKHDWILSIDADEALDDKMQQHLLSLKHQGLNGVYDFNRLTNYCGKWIKNSGWYPDWKIRLFDKNLVEWTGEYVHETLDIPENQTVTKISGHLLHYSYYDFKEHQERADKYSVLTAKKMHAKGKKASFIKPYLSAFGRWFAMFIIKGGWKDGFMGWKIASISAKSNILKYKELRRLNNG